ncbi:tripartite tricarboxylate transporter TctB family protein [Falsirhodobacter sp. 1013]|uniref:tripartite tricarboxylate transporter TctB family protein n=1 Tax=Falsirhodobacter sp. 1013 TaxID=3417566 RepID=UPI003EBDDFD4
MTRTEMILRNRDVLSGLLFLLVAGIFAYGAHRLPLGSTLRMGPGYFPLVLCAVLTVLAVVTILNGVRKASVETAAAPLAWGRMLVICGAGVFFALALVPLGLPLAVFGAVVTAAAASRDFRPLPGLALGVLTALGAWLIFAEALDLPFRFVGTWLTFLKGAP